MSSKSVVAGDIFILFKGCNFLADADNTFSLFSQLVIFVSYIWELHALGAGVFWLPLKTIFLNMVPRNFLPSLTVFPIFKLLKTYILSPKKKY